MKRTDYLPYCQVKLGTAEIEEVRECLESGWLTMGSKVIAFEEQFATYIGSKYAVSVNSCTAALSLALLAHGIGPGDEVLVPSFTFVASVNVIVHAGATPVFVDINPDTLNFDVVDASKKVTAKTKAIIAVHYAGLPVDLAAIMALADQKKLIVIEDAAHAVGSEYKGTKIGASGNTTCFSFYATKTMTTGEGGMLTTNDSTIADFVMRARIHGISKDAWKRYSKSGTWQYDVILPGYKCNMTDIQAAMGIHQLKKLDTFIERRAEIVALYDAAFAKISQITTLKTPQSVKHSYHLYPILLNGVDRDTFIDLMTAANIGTSVHFIPIHQFSYYTEHFPVATNDLKVTTEIGSKIVSLPLYPAMTNQDVKDVISAVTGCIKKRK